MEQIQELEVHEEAYTTYEPLDELCSRHHPDNPKDHDLGSLIESIQEFGFVRNVMINETDNLLLYGHGTTEALWQMLEGGEYQVPKRIKVREDGMWLVPTDRGIRLSKKRAKAYVIADNRHSELGGWNEPRLVDNLIAIAGKDGRGLRGTGFDGDELDTLIRMYRPELIETPEDPGAQLDKAEELQKKWQVERGQIWEIGRHRLMCGDSTNSDVEILIDTEIGAIITDPPYGLGDTKSFNKDHPDYEDENPFDLQTIDLSFPFVVMGGNYYEWLPEPRNKIGWLVWDKRPDLEGDKRKRADRIFGQHFEIGITSIGELRGKMFRYRWGGYYGDEEIQHKTQKPIELMQIFIKATNGIVLDYFLGSGTTMVAAEQLNRICYGMEIEPKYCAVTLERMSGMGLTPKLVHG